ncbi:MAG: hypothetical protein K1X91_10195 [Bacteriodetes bacterium]|nr:hypothetical protein [Bacteroidota bacterium]
MANITQLSLPQPDPFNIQAVKRYVFNETGNIMLVSTDEKSDTIQQSVRDVFAEVSVFFAAMTKAISQSTNPNGTPDKTTGQLPNYSLYNYDALEAVIDGSGYFVHINEEDVSYTTSSWGANFSQELIEAILGLATGAGELGFASAMINTMGKEGVNISGQSSSLTSQVANIIFVCEYLLGMPVVSAIVVTADAQTVAQTVTLGPCFKEQSSSTTMTVHKDTYMFVTPAFIKQYAGDLSSIMNDPAYLKLIMELESLVERTPTVDGVYEIPTQGDPIPIPGGGNLKSGTSYVIFGEFLGTNVAGKSNLTVSPTTNGVTITPGTWNDEGIKFTITYTGDDVVAETINITLSDGTTVLSVGSYMIEKSGT